MTSTPATNIRNLANRRALLVFGFLLLAGIAGVALWKHLASPPKPWLVRWRVARYLKKQTGQSDFKIEFPFSSAAQMAKAPSKQSGAVQTLGKLTGKEFETLKTEYIELQSSLLALERKIAAGKQKFRAEAKAKEDALAPITSDLWDFQRAWLAEGAQADVGSAQNLNRARAELVNEVREKLSQAGSYAQIYEAIGQELWVAQRLLSSANPEHRRVGTDLALQASKTAQEDAQNGWLAGRICEGYIWPQLVATVAERGPRSTPSAENLINECADIFRRNDEWENVVRSYQLLIASNPARADWARAQIGAAFEQGGDVKNALTYFHSIKATNDFKGILKRIPRLERQLKR